MHMDSGQTVTHQIYPRSQSPYPVRTSAMLKDPPTWSIKEGTYAAHQPLECCSWTHMEHKSAHYHNRMAYTNSVCLVLCLHIHGLFFIYIMPSGTELELVGPYMQKCPILPNNCFPDENKPLSEPMLTQFYDTICCHLATISWIWENEPKDFKK